MHFSITQIQTSRLHLPPISLLLRTNASLTTSQNLVQSLKDEVTKIRTEKDTLQKELDAKVADIQEKVKTITQVKKIGRRYKTQYEELKAQHDKVDMLFLCMQRNFIKGLYVFIWSRV